MKQSKLDLEQLARFVAVAEAGGFSLASQRLGVPKSTLSRAVKQLEDTLGVRLLQRTTRQVALSSAGQALLDKTAPLLAQLLGAVEALPELEEAPSGHLVVTAPVDIAAALLADVVARFVVRTPHVTVEVRSSNLVLDLVKEGIDVALRITMGPHRDSSLVARRVAPIHMHLYAAPTYLARRGTPRTAAEAADHTWVAYAALRRLKLTAEGESLSVPLKPAIVGDDMAFVVAAVRGGAGLGALPTFLAAPWVESGALVRVLPRYIVPGGSLSLVTASRTGVPRKVAAFREFVVQNLRVPG